MTVSEFKTQLKYYWDLARKSVVFPWVVVFLVGGLAVPQNGGQLELPRMLTMRAMAEHHTFQIGRYIDWTGEWARNPKGEYYNNRAPGPVLLGFPLYYIVDRINRPGEKVFRDEKGRRPWPGRSYRTILSFFLQMVPMGLLVLFGASILRKRGASDGALHFFALGCLFGATPSIFMNNYSGHGLVAWFVLALVLAMYRRNYLCSGLFFGLALLSDYSAGMLLIPLIAVLVWENGKSWQWIKPFVLGGLFPGVLWIWYHTSAFGSPFAIANHYQNPMYVDLRRIEGNLWGIFRPFPDWEILTKLLFSQSRGILFTQAWVLVGSVVGFLCLWRKNVPKDVRRLFVWFLSSLVLLLWMNSSFGGWHAGNTAGPRYIALIFPAFAWILALVWGQITTWEKQLLWVGLGAALIFRGMVFAIHPMAPNVPLWQWLGDQIVQQEGWSNTTRLMLYFVLFGIAGFYIQRKQKSPAH